MKLNIKNKSIKKKSDSVANIAQTAKSGLSSGVGYLYGKLFGSERSETSTTNRNQISSENYKRNAYEETEPEQYVKMDENFNQKFLDN